MKRFLPNIFTHLRAYLFVTEFQVDTVHSYLQEATLPSFHVLNREFPSKVRLCKINESSPRHRESRQLINAAGYDITNRHDRIGDATVKAKSSGRVERTSTHHYVSQQLSPSPPLCNDTILDTLK